MKAILCAVMVSLCCTLALGQAQYKVLWSFFGFPNDGSEPVSGLVFDQNGNLYGTTKLGGSGISRYGTIFELSPQNDGTWTEAVLYSFCSVSGCLDGAQPMAGLALDSAGNLYGTTVYGGANPCDSDEGSCGTVFELSPPSQPGGSWTETVLYSFCADGASGGCQDGAEPTSQLTIRDGKLYGTTTTGGTGGFSNPSYLGGTVFQLSPGKNGWTHTVLYNFCADGRHYVCPDGSAPQAGVTFDDTGNLYGTTRDGGSLHGFGDGTVYKLSPGSDGWTETVLSSHAFDQDGGPLGEVAVDKLDNIYGTFSSGGSELLRRSFWVLPERKTAKDVFIRRK